jgi:hypothetical protein
VCLVEAKKMRRLLLHSMYNLLGKRSRVKILASPDEALEWVQGQLAGAGAAGREEERAGAPAGELEAVVTNRIGEFLVRIGEMTAAEVEQVLDVQKGGDKRRFGDIAIELGFVRGGAIRSYVEFLEDRVDKNDSRS